MWLRAIIFFDRLRHPVLQLLNARAVRWVIGEQLGRLRGIGLFHSSPKADAFARVVSGARHVNESDVIRFRFMIATKRHEHAVLRSGAKCAQNHPLLLVIHVGERAGQSHHCRLGKVLVKNALRSMPGRSVRHFMAKHSGKRSFAIRHWQNSRIDNNFPTGQTKRVYLIALDERYAPVEILSICSCSRGQALHDTLNHFQLRPRVDRLGLGKDLLVALQAERRLLLD